jgi:NTP pyrophosphatase (non-canonical NTP hydrolase)
MNLQTYQERSKRTVNWSLEKNLQLAGFVLGIVGETGELKQKLEGMYTGIDNLVEDIKDEGGDVLFYIVNLCSVLDLDWTNLLPEVPRRHPIPRTMFDELHKYNGLLADVIKKTTVQHHTLDLDTTIEALQGIVSALLEIFHCYDITPEDVCEFNYNKLLKRYPNGFEASRSINREVS